MGNLCSTNEKSSPERSVKIWCLNVKDVEFSSCIGEIYDDDSDAIVYTASTDTALSPSTALPNWVTSKGGNSIQEEFDKCVTSQGTYGEIKPGNLIITSGGSLKAKYIFHICCPYWGDHNEESIMEHCIMNCFLRADEYKLQSIAFSSLSNNKYGGFPKEKSVSILVNQAMKFITENTTTTIKKIRLVTMENHITKIFKDEVIKATNPAHIPAKGPEPMIRLPSTTTTKEPEKISKPMKENNHVGEEINGSASKDTTSRTIETQEKPNNITMGTTSGIMTTETKPDDKTKATSSRIMATKDKHEHAHEKKMKGVVHREHHEKANKIPEEQKGEDVVYVSEPVVVGYVKVDDQGKIIETPANLPVDIKANIMGNMGGNVPVDKETSIQADKEVNVPVNMEVNQLPSEGESKTQVITSGPMDVQSLVQQAIDIVKEKESKGVEEQSSEAQPKNVSEIKQDEGESQTQVIKSGPVDVQKLVEQAIDIVKEQEDKGVEEKILEAPVENVDEVKNIEEEVKTDNVESVENPHKQQEGQNQVEKLEESLLEPPQTTQEKQPEATELKVEGEESKQANEEKLERQNEQPQNTESPKADNGSNMDIDKNQHDNYPSESNQENQMSSEQKEENVNKESNQGDQNQGESPKEGNQ